MPKFELKGKVALDGSKWKAGLQQADREAEKFSSKMAGRLGGAIKTSLIGAIVGGVAAGVALAIKSLPKAARIRDFASRVGVTPERFQQMEFAANQSGATGEQVVAAIKGLSKTQQRANETIVDSKTGATKFRDMGMRETFAKFGITDEELSLPPAALFQAIGSKVGQGFNREEALADLQKIMEESGVALLPVFKAGMEETMKRAKDLGVIAGADVGLLSGLDDKKTDLMFAAGNKAATATAATARIIKNARNSDAKFMSVHPGAPPPVYFELKRTLDQIEKNTKPLNQ